MTVFTMTFIEKFYTIEQSTHENVIVAAALPAPHPSPALRRLPFYSHFLRIRIVLQFVPSAFVAHPARHPSLPLVLHRH